MSFGEIDALGSTCYRCGRLIRDHARGFDCGPGTYQPPLEKDQEEDQPAEPGEDLEEPMKKSEYEKSVRERVAGADFLGLATEAVVAHIVAAAVAEREAAGVVWHAEEEPLPERLELTEVGQVRDATSRQVLGYFYENFAREGAECVRRWNAWPEIRRAVDGLGLGSGIRLRILHILDGKEGK